MPVQTPQWCDLLCCCICYNVFDGIRHQPVSLVCGHTACRSCLLKLKSKQCPFDQSAINIPVADLPQNMPILKILEAHEPVATTEDERLSKLFEKGDLKQYRMAADILDSLASYLRRAQSEKGGSVWSPQLSRPMQRKLVTLLCCQLVEPEGRGRALKAIRSLGERSLMELLLLHQNPYHLSSNLWAAVRARGCQFLGPAMQEEVLKLVLLALSEGALISRKVLVMYIVQTLEKDYPQASKTSVGHVVQLLYRASCFNVIKRDGESSLMQLKEEFRTYEALRREHDAQIVQIAMEAGLRISPDQWSALLYGDQAHKSHMQSIIDRLQTPQSFAQSIQELLIGLQRTGDPGNLVELRPHYELLADIDATQGENVIPTWNAIVDALVAVKAVVEGQARFCERYGGNRNQRESIERSVVAYKFKTSMCRDIGESKTCPRGESCTFAHSLEEMERYRARSRLMGYRSNVIKPRGAMDGNGDGGQADGSRSDNEYDFDESDIYEIEPKPKGPQQQHPMPHHQPPMAQQSTIMVGGPRQGQPPPPPQPPPTALYPPPAAFQTSPEDGSPGTMIMNSPPPPHFAPGATTVMMQSPTRGLQFTSGLGNGQLVVSGPPGATIVNTPNGPIALGSAHPGTLQLGTTVRYQVFRHGVPCAPAAPPPSQALQAPVPVAPAPPEYGYYWYPQAGMQPRPASVYHPGEVLHLEVPLARMVPGHQVAGATTLTAPGGVTAAVAGGPYPGPAAYPEIPPAPTNPVAQAASVTPYGNYTFAQGDPTALYFYPPAPEPHAAHAATVGPFGVYMAPAVEDMVMYPAAGSMSTMTNGMAYQMSDMGDGQEGQQQQHPQKVAAYNQASGQRRMSISSSVSMDTKNVISTSTSCTNSQLVVASSSSKMALSSCVAPASCSGMGVAGNCSRNKEDTEKQSRLIQLEMKKHEIMKCLSSIKKESVSHTKSQPAQRSYMPRSQQEGAMIPRSSSDSDPADILSSSIATSVLQDDYPIINYAAAVLRGRQGAALPLTSTGAMGYNSSANDSGYWSSANTSMVSSPASVVSSTGRGTSSQAAGLQQSTVPSSLTLSAATGFAPRRSVSADATGAVSNIDYSPWKSSASSSSGSTAWSHSKSSLTAANGSSAKTGYGYATRPYIPDEYIDIKHLSDDVLRKELEQIPQTTKRAHYVRLELEAREADAWRSEDDQVIPFSNCGPQVSRYGPISRAGQRMQASVSMSTPLSAISAASDKVVQVKDILHQPLPTAAVQPTKDQPMVSRDDVDPSQIVSSIPQVFKVAPSIDSSMVDEKLEKLVEVKSKLACIPLEEGPSSAEKEQLKLELELINKEISMLDKHTGEEYLLKALENVNLNIEELQQQQQQPAA